MLDLFGQALAPASPSAPPAKAKGMKTSATYGRLGTGSSASASLQLSLASRLQAQVEGLGSTLFALTWKTIITPSGRRICQQRASGRRTSDSASASWPRPTVTSGAQIEANRGVGGQTGGSTLAGVATLASWPTPLVNDGLGSDYCYGPKKPDGTRAIFWKLPGAAKLASWPTPMAGTPAQKGYNAAGNTDYSRRVVDLASWATPTTRDWKDGSYCENVPENALLGRQVWQASGPPPNGSPAATAKPGQLNPSMSRWLMGLPAIWDLCAPAKKGEEADAPQIDRDGGASVRAMRQDGLQTACPPSGREPGERQPVELADFVRLLPSSLALAELHRDTATTDRLRALLEASGAQGLVQYAPDAAEAAWRSLGEEGQNRFRLAVEAGAWMRTVEHPLAHGAPAQVGRLRAYGNAIVAPVAAEFIRAAMT
jgi:hypothetical protein